MLTRIDVNSENAFYVPILGVTPKDSIICQSVGGLTPPDRDLFIGDYSRDGGFYQGNRVGSRNVVPTFTLNPNPALGETVSGLREMLYKAFYDPLIDADYLQLGLHLDDGRLLYVVGYAEKFEGEIFSDDTNVQISLICPDPYIRDQTPVTLTHPSGWTQVPFSYSGTADTGFFVQINVTTATSKLTIDNNGKQMILNRSFNVDDIVRINTVAGEHSVTVETSGVETSILNALSVTSPWISLHSQANTLKVYGNTTTDIVAAIRELTFTQTYWGV